MSEKGYWPLAESFYRAHAAPESQAWQYLPYEQRLEWACRALETAWHGEAALRAPQPRGLTGDAIREECAKIADEATVTGPAEARDHIDDANDAACRAIAERIRALNLSAIEGAPAPGGTRTLFPPGWVSSGVNDVGAPAAGEREVVDGLLKFWHAILQRLGQSTLDSEVVRDLAETAGLITVTDHDEKTCQLEACVACEEGWSEVYAETEIVAQARRAAYRSAVAPASPRSAAPEDK